MENLPPELLTHIFVYLIDVTCPLKDVPFTSRAPRLKRELVHASRVSARWATMLYAMPTSWVTVIGVMERDRKSHKNVKIPEESFQTVLKNYNRWTDWKDADIDVYLTGSTLFTPVPPLEHLLEILIPHIKRFRILTIHIKDDFPISLLYSTISSLGTLCSLPRLRSVNLWLASPRTTVALSETHTLIPTIAFCPQLDHVSLRAISPFGNALDASRAPLAYVQTLVVNSLAEQDRPYWTEFSSTLSGLPYLRVLNIGCIAFKEGEFASLAGFQLPVLKRLVCALYARDFLFFLQKATMHSLVYLQYDGKANWEDNDVPAGNYNFRPQPQITSQHHSQMDFPFLEEIHLEELCPSHVISLLELLEAPNLTTIWTYFHREVVIPPHDLQPNTSLSLSRVSSLSLESIRVDYDRLIIYSLPNSYATLRELELSYGQPDRFGQTGYSLPWVLETPILLPSLISLRIHQPGSHLSSALTSTWPHLRCPQLTDLSVRGYIATLEGWQELSSLHPDGVIGKKIRKLEMQCSHLGGLNGVKFEAMDAVEELNVDMCDPPSDCLSALMPPLDVDRDVSQIPLPNLKSISIIIRGKSSSREVQHLLDVLSQRAGWTGDSDESKLRVLKLSGLVKDFTEDDWKSFTGLVGKVEIGW